jgi:energy-coupling factor transporter ATP-binding protein EcfA2
MNKLEIKYFKAFKNELLIDIQNKNLLIYGENGAGKSSIYEALKVVFFRRNLEPNALTPEEQEQVRRDFWSKYNNSSSNRDFEIKVNDIDHQAFSTEPYQAFMISINETFVGEKIRYDFLLEKLYCDLEGKIFCLESYTDIQKTVNDILESFHEHVKIEIDNEDDFTIKIIDEARAIESKTEIKKYFNEAKINLIVLLLLFVSIEFVEKPTKKRILVLDDFITSLDIANRTFLLKFIFDKFSKFQIIVLTHNVNFYNLSMFLINEIFDPKNSWNFGNIYAFDNDNKFYFRNSNRKVEEIIKAYELNPQPIMQIGNEIRQTFEILLYEFSKLLMIGAVEDGKKILEYLGNKKIYFKRENKINRNATDLVEDLKITINSPNQHNLKERLISKIDSYDLNDLGNLKDILKKLTIYQKITMHPLSHGSIGQTSFSPKEIEMSLVVLKQFELYLDKLSEKDVSGI